jgi:hypothetical protein
METVEMILSSFDREDMMSADQRKRIERLVGDYYSVVMMSPDVTSPFDREFAEWAVDKFVRLEAI